MYTQANPDPGLFYARGYPPFLQLFQGWEKATQAKVREEFGERIDLIEQTLNADYAIGAYYMPMVFHENLVGFHPQRDILTSAYHRNLFALYASFELTSRGLFGPARSVLRHVFESLIVAKFCALSSVPSVHTKWQQGQTIYFTNSVLNKIRNPSPTIFKEFWGIMSEFVHASVYAQQMSFDWQHLHDNVPFTLDLILALIECHYHILTSHIATPSVRYYTEYALRHTAHDNDFDIAQTRNAIRSLFSAAKKSTKPFFRRLIKDYKRTWIVDP